MYQSKELYKNYYSQEKKISYGNSKNSKGESPRNNSYHANILKEFALKKKSNSQLNINVSHLSFIPKLNNVSYETIKTKKFRSYTEKSQLQDSKSRSIGKNLQRYKIKKIQQKTKDMLRSQKQKQVFHIPLSPNNYGSHIKASESSKKILSARKISDRKVQLYEKGQTQPQTHRNVNLQIQISNLNQIFPSKKLQSNVPQTTKSIMHYNKTAKRNQMALNIKNFQQNKAIFKKQKQKQIQKSQRKIQNYRNQVNQYKMQKDLMLSKTTFKKDTKPTMENSKFLIKRQSENISIKDFYIYRQLGKGQNGKIYSAFHLKTGCIVALKHFQNSKLIVDYLVDQMKIQLFCKHPNILAAYGYIIQKSQQIFTSQYQAKKDNIYSTQKKEQQVFRPFYNIYIIMQKGQSNLFSVVKKAGKLTQQQTAIFTEQILNGLKYLHENNIIHRDLKPENIILCNGVCKITDFGWSVIGSQERQTFCGTLEYVSPEVAVGSRYDNKIDVWSVGILIFQMLTGQAPYDTNNILQNPKQQYRKRILSRLPSHTSYECKQLMSKLLKIDPKRRITLQQALNHRWIKDNTLRKTMRKDISLVSQQFQKILKQK